MAFGHFVRTLSTFCSWLTVVPGILLNLTLIGLIRTYTPKSMQIYSKILLQNCFTDILLLISVLFSDPSYFFTSKGEVEFILNGIWQTQNADLRWVNLALLLIWHFLTYVSLFGFVNQFIYRYLVLNWERRPSTLFYFSTFAAILTIPLAFTIALGIVYYPLDANAFLTDKNVAELLAINLTTEKILLAAHSVRMNAKKMGSNYFYFIQGQNLLLTVDLYYIIICCTFAYAILCILGFLMHRHVRKETFGQKNFLNKLEQKKIVELNRQITRNLLIQAALPFTIYGPLLFGIITEVAHIDLGAFGQYFYMLEPVPMFFPPALNPIISIIIIKNYRRGLMEWMENICKTFSNLIYRNQVDGTNGTIALQSHQQNTHSEY